MEIEFAATAIVDVAVKVHRAAGPGMLESTYETMMEHELRKRGMRVERQKYIDLTYEDLIINRAFCIDLIINEEIVVEIKSVEKLAAIHMRQVLTYLRMTNLTLGFLLNFGQMTLKEGGLHRIMNGHKIPPKY